MITCLHNHMKSEFDAVAPIKSYLQAAIDKGYECIAVTDHGSVAALADVYELVNADDSPFNKLKIIYGTEGYVELAGIPVKNKVGHIIIMAIDEQGKHAIDKLLSKAPIIKDKPVFTREFLEEWQDYFKGHVIATSACIAGAPAMAFKTNAFFEKEISHLESMRINALNSLIKDISSITEYDGILKEYEAISEEEYDSISDAITKENDLYKTKFDETVAKVVDLRSEKKELQKLAKKSFVSMEKKLDKLKSLNAENANEFENELNALKEKSSNAANMIETIDEQISELWNHRGIYNSIVKTYSKFYDKLEDIDNHITTCYESMCSIEECRKNAKSELLYFDELFGHNHYLIELQYHGIPEEATIYKELAKLAKELKIPVVAANDAHIPGNEQKYLDQRQVAKFLRFGKNVSTPEEEQYDAEMYIKSEDELKTSLLQILPESVVDTAIKNANHIGDICKYVPDKKNHYPVFDKDQDSNELLRKLAYKGAKWRFPNALSQEYRERLEYELDVICKMGYADYHLIVKDFLEYARACGPIPEGKLDDAPLDISGVIQYCKDNHWDVGIGTGFGRGSAGGSLVCYVLGITNVDPIPYGLIFERFLNVERISMPDIDSDFRPDIREKAIQYVQKKYGHNAVVSIMTESRQGVKGAIRDAARYLGQKLYDDPNQCLSLGNMIRKKVPSDVGMSFDTIVDETNNETCYDMLKAMFSNDSVAVKIIDLAKNIEGSFTSFGMHAAGVIIPDTEDITDYIALRWNPKKERYTTQCNMVQAESAEGLLKMDFLGLKNLGIFTEAAQIIEEIDGDKIDFDHIPFEEEVFKEIYAKGRTKNVFQFESAGMRKYLKELNPSNIEDIVAMNALYRPGPMDFIPEFIESKKKEDMKTA